MKIALTVLSMAVLMISAVTGAALAGNPEKNEACKKESLEFTIPETSSKIAEAVEMSPIGRSWLEVIEVDGLQFQVSRQDFLALDSIGEKVRVSAGCVGSCVNCSVSGCLVSATGCTACDCKGRGCSNCVCGSGFTLAADDGIDAYFREVAARLTQRVKEKE